MHIVSKFGGTSVATSSNLSAIRDIISENDHRRVIVLSAPGKAPGVSTKVTDYLISIVEKVQLEKDPSKEIQLVKDRYRKIYGEFGLGLESNDISAVVDELDARVQGEYESPEQFRDAVVASGEQFSAQLFTLYLNKQNVSAQCVLPQDIDLEVTDSHGDAQITPRGKENLKALHDLADETVVIFPGFYGITAEGNVATFSRGGSDLTGALIAEAISAKEYENFTDVDGILSANPNIVLDPEQVTALTYREMRELSYMGFNVFHEEAVLPVMEQMIPIRLRNTNNMDNTGTLIVSERLPEERDVIGIACDSGYCSFNVSKFLMDREKGFGRRLLSIFEELDLSFEHAPTGVDDISVVLSQEQMHPGTVNTVVRRIDEQLTPDDVKVEFGISLVSVVGEGLLHKIGVLGKAATALGNAGINVITVNQGSSELSIIFGIDSADEKKAVRALYECFFEDE